METTIHKITSRYLESFFEINLDLARAVEHLKSRANDLRAWAEVFVAAQPTVSPHPGPKVIAERL